MKIYKITEASEYLGVSINTLKTLANNGKTNSFKTSGGHLDEYDYEADKKIAAKLLLQHINTKLKASYPNLSIHS